jgi:CSLREA domain-containing protein
MLKRLAFLTMFVVGLLAMSGTASAGNIKVTTTLDELDIAADATCSLREAISTANTDGNVGGCTDPNPASANDTVSLTGGTYRLTRVSGPEDNNFAGDLDVTEALTISGTGADHTVINGNGAIIAERVLHLTAGTLTLKDLRVHGGAAGAGSGGGILSISAGFTLTLIDSAVSGNSASNGGGIQASGVILTRSSVSGNHAQVSAGGINAAQARLTDSSVTHNAADGGGGGGIDASATLTRSTVSDNIAQSDGGGVQGSATMTDSKVERNRAGGNGGGVLANVGSLMTVTRSTISGNEAGIAGGGFLLSSAGSFTIKNSTVSGNAAKGAGGGLQVDEGTATLNNVTIARNSADADSIGDEGGAGVFQASTGVLRLRNTLVAENDDAGNPSPDCRGTLTNPSHTAFTSGGCIVSGTSVGVIQGGSPLGGLEDNGGLTPTHELLPGNLAINAGYPGTGAGVPCEAKDQRGLPRNGRCDIGAFEVQP